MVSMFNKASRKAVERIANFLAKMTLPKRKPVSGKPIELPPKPGQQQSQVSDAPAPFSVYSRILELFKKSNPSQSGLEKTLEQLKEQVDTLIKSTAAKPKESGPQWPFWMAMGTLGVTGVNNICTYIYNQNNLNHQRRLRLDNLNNNRHSTLVESQRLIVELHEAKIKLDKIEKAYNKKEGLEKTKEEKYLLLHQKTFWQSTNIILDEVAKLDKKIHKSDKKIRSEEEVTKKIKALQSQFENSRKQIAYYEHEINLVQKTCSHYPMIWTSKINTNNQNDAKNSNDLLVNNKSKNS